MVLTRLSHVGEVCPLSDHSYSDSLSSFNMGGTVATTNSSTVSVQKNKVSRVCDDKGPCTKVVCNTITFHVNILYLPNEILEKIFSSISYKNLGDLRCVCKRFDKVAGNILNTAFLRLQNQMLVRFQATKSMMPRRESARRKHPLARESDILEMLHMRLTLLQMTFGKHIERKNCCFFAGEILDEVHRILRCIKMGPNFGKVFKITDELFDLSTMAMEYFKEFIEPSLPVISYFHSDLLDFQNRYSDSDDEPDPAPQSSMVLRKRIRKIRQGMRRYNSQLTNMKRELRTYKNRIVEQNKQMSEYTARMEEYDKKFDEASRKFNTVLQELNRCKTELQYWRSRSPIQAVVCCNCCSRAHSSESGKVGSSMDDLNEPLFVNRPLIVTSSSPSNPIIKNLQSLFDGHEFPSTSDYCAPSTSSSDQGSLTSSGANNPDESSNKRSTSSEDDSDNGVDTVGRRVKERKRMKHQ